MVADEACIELTVEDFLALYYPRENNHDFDQYLMYPRRKKQVVREMKNFNRY